MARKTSIFDDSFTGKYQLSKTLRFELKPTPKTEELLKEHHILEKDYTIDESYHQAKYYFDAIHREFLDFALAPEKAREFSFAKLQDAYAAYLKLEKEERRNDQNFRRAKQAIREEIKKHLDAEANKWIKPFLQRGKDESEEENGSDEGDEKKNMKGTKFLCSAKILPILKSKFPEKDEETLQKEGKPSLFVIDRHTQEKKYIFSTFDRFTTYLGKFQATRNNLYLTGGEATAVPTRLVSNFLIFLNNRKAFDGSICQIAKGSSISNADLLLLDPAKYHLSVLQPGIEAYNETIGAINKRVKEWRDQAKKEERSKYPRLKRLEKQILAEVEKRIELVESDEDIPPRFHEFVQETEGRMKEARELLARIFDGELDDKYDKIFINHKAANSLAYQFFTYPVGFLAELPQATKTINRENPKVAPFVSIADMVAAMEKVGQKDNERAKIFKPHFYQEEGKRDGIVSEKWDYRTQLFAVWKNEIRELYDGAQYDNGGERIFGFDKALKEAKDFLKSVSTFGDKSRKRENDIAVIKRYADAVLAIHQRLSHFALEAKKEDDKPTEYSEAFYEDADNVNGMVARGLTSLFRWGEKDIDIARDGKNTRETLNDEKGMPLLTRYYNAFRNHLTRKPNDEEKVKINFDNGSLLGGWDKNKEQEKCGVILRRGGKYYLGVLRKTKGRNEEQTNLAMFDEKKHPEAYHVRSEFYEKMEYKLFPDPKRMIPKIAFANKNLKRFGWTQEIQDIKDEYAAFQESKSADSDLWSESFNKNKLQKLIAYYQKCLEIGGYKKTFGFMWREPSAYSGMGEFNDEIARKNYKIRFIPVDEKYVDERIAKGELYLFEIHNKDWNLKKVGGKYITKTGSKNLHTLYFNLLLREENIDVFKLDGEAEIFYRPEEKEPTIKKDKTGKEIIEHWRYAKPKWQLHLKMRMNRRGIDAKRRGYTKRFNDEVNLFLSKDKENINIIGIDRGEKHLVYFMVIDQRQNILDGGSLNKIGEKGKEVDYHALLHDRMKEREKNRRSWEPVRQIKDLKRGYIGAVVRRICDLAIKHDAIIVFEDLSFRFKQVRGGIEKSTYQQIEKALIDKLGYLTFKDRDDDEPGGVLRGYQLAAPFESFENIGKQKQTGIVFYTQAAYTSALDPLTGFRKTVYMGSSTSQKEIKRMFDKFEKIFWDNKEKSYCFVYNSKNFISEQKGKKESGAVIDKEWSVYGNAPRVIRERKERGHWDTRLVAPDKMIEDLLGKYNFDVRGDIKAQIEKIGENKLAVKKEFDGRERNFRERLAYIFNLICQVRNSTSREYRMNKEGKLEEIGNDVDFIASPVKPFFTTGAKWKEYIVQENLAGFEKRFLTSEAKKLLTNDENGNTVFNGDANGAYNIARKGIILLGKSQKTVSNKEFDHLAQG